MSSINIKNLSKSFGSVQALKNVSLTLEGDKIYALLGRNGAGKSTLLKIITNRLFADSGEVMLDNTAITENDKMLGQIYLMSESTYYPESMKITKAFKWSKEFYPNFDAEYAQKLAEKFELNINKSVKSLSTGYSSIFKLIIALSVNTPFIFLDEPVLGLDANHRDLFYQVLAERYSENPSTIVISTHLIEEISGLVEDVIIINSGEIIRNESCENLLASGYTISGKAAAVDEFIKDKEVIGQDSLGGLKTAYLIGKAENIPQSLEVSKLDLQKLFVKLTSN